MAEKTKKTTEVTEAVTTPVEKTEATFDPNRRYWKDPSKRGKTFAEERKNKVHMEGDKEGEELTDYELGYRSGYLKANNDHAGKFIYRTVYDNTTGNTADRKEKAQKASWDKGFWKKNKSKFKKK